MKIAIIGTGGVGGYFGGRLAQNGHDVTFVARGEHLKAIKQNGLLVNSINGNFKIDNVKATDNIGDLDNVDLIILGIKSWQVKKISSQLKQIISDHTLVLPLQNGVLAIEELSTSIDTKNIVGGLCRIISKIESPGVINHFAVEPTIVLGVINHSTSKLVAQICETINNSGIKARIADDFMIDLWNKLMVICLSGLLAVTRSTYGEIREVKETREIMTAILTEIYNVANATGVKLERNIVEKTIAYVDSYPYDATTSLARDVWEGKPSEIQYQNGTIVNLGKKYGVATPANDFIYACILPLDNKARKKPTSQQNSKSKI